MSDSDADELRLMLSQHANDARMAPSAVDAAVVAGRARGRRRITAVGLLVAVVAAAAPIAWSAAGPAAVVTPVPTASISSTSPRPTQTQTPSPTPSASATPSAPALPLGAAPAIPYAVGNTIVDGDLRVTAPGDVERFVTFQDAYAVVTRSSAGPRLFLVSADGTSQTIDDSDDVTNVVASDSPAMIAWGTGHEFTDEQGNLSATYALHTWSPDGGSASIGVESVDLAYSVAFVDAIAGDQVVFSYAADPGGVPWVWDTVSGETRPFIPGLEEVGNRMSDLSEDSTYALIFSYITGCYSGYRVSDGAELWTNCGSTPDLTGLAADAVAFRHLDGGAVVTLATGTTVLLDLTPDALLNAYMTTWEDPTHLLIPEQDVQGMPVIYRCNTDSGACEIAQLDAVGHGLVAPVLPGTLLGP